MAKPDPDKRPWAATRQGLAEELAKIDGVLPGSVVVRRMRCGKAGCACKGDPPALHGPYIQWTRTVAGKTVTRFLSNDDLARYQQWFDNARRLKELVAVEQWDLLRINYLPVGWLAGGMMAWRTAALDIDGLPQITVHELKRRLDDGLVDLLDVRQPGEWAQGHVADATFITAQCSGRCHQPQSRGQIRPGSGR